MTGDYIAEGWPMIELLGTFAVDDDIGNGNNDRKTATPM